MSSPVLTKVFVVAAGTAAAVGKAMAAGAAASAVWYALDWVASRLRQSPATASPEPLENALNSGGEEKPKKVSRKELNRLLKPTYGEYNRLAKQSEMMMQYRGATVETLKTVAGELESKHCELSLDRLIGSIAGLAGVLIWGMDFTSVLLTAGAGALPAYVGGAVLAMGTTASISAYLYEKMLESKCLAKVKKTVEKDRDQCVKVQRMFDEFKSYPQPEVVNDLSVKCCIQNFKIDVEADIAAKTYTVREVAEPVNKLYEKLSNSKGTQDAKWRPEIILGAVFSGAGLAILSSALSYISNNADFVLAIAAYILIAAVGLGNIFMLVLYFYEGPHSKVAKKIRKKSSELEQRSDVEGELLSVPFCQNIHVAT